MPNLTRRPNGRGARSRLHLPWSVHSTIHPGPGACHPIPPNQCCRQGNSGDREFGEPNNAFSFPISPCSPLDPLGVPVRRWTPLGSLFDVGPPWGPCSFIGALRAGDRLESGLRSKVQGPNSTARRVAVQIENRQSAIENAVPQSLRPSLFQPQAFPALCLSPFIPRSAFRVPRLNGPHPAFPPACHGISSRRLVPA